MNNGSISHSTNLNILRSVAVLSVFLGHGIQFVSQRLEPSARAVAHFGVMCFFVHTSLVLMHSLERQEQDGSSRLWFRFMVRRAFRIYPLAMIAVLLSSAFSIPCITGCQTLRTDTVTPASLLANLALVQEFFSLPSTPCVLWSLPYEMLMYCFLPLLYILARKRDHVMLIALWACAGVAVNLISGTILFAPLRFAPCFISGVIAYRIGYRPKLHSSLWLFLIVATVLAVAWLRPELLFFDWALCLLLGVAIPHFREIRSGFLSRASELIAKHSFGIYLAHLGMYRLAFGVFHLDPTLAIVVAGVLTMLISIAAYRTIELPMIRLGASLDSFTKQARGASTYEREATTAA